MTSVVKQLHSKATSSCSRAEHHKHCTCDQCWLITRSAVFIVFFVKIELNLPQKHILTRTSSKPNAPWIYDHYFTKQNNNSFFFVEFFKKITIVIARWSPKNAHSLIDKYMTIVSVCTDMKIIFCCIELKFSPQSSFICAIPNVL